MRGGDGGGDLRYPATAAAGYRNRDADPSTPGAGCGCIRGLTTLSLMESRVPRITLTGRERELISLLAEDPRM